MLWLRILMIVGGLAAGYGAGSILAGPDPDLSALINTASLSMAGALAGWIFAPRVEKFWAHQLEKIREWYGTLSLIRVTAGTVGLVVALLVSVLLSTLLDKLPFYSWPLSILTTIGLAFFFITFSLRNEESFGGLVPTQEKQKRSGKLLDSNIIIDGRILDLARTGFLEGELVIPAFILREIQTLADHSDAQKRTRGKRGLQIMEELRQIHPIHIEDWDDPLCTTTDDKLIRLAREMNSKIITNDGNLTKIAKLHGLQILSIHEAAVALRPQLQAGDTLALLISKNGQQSGQGVGFLEDGTMVIVEEAQKLRGKTVKVVVVNNVQNNMGRMIFARLDKEDV